ncbi:MAG: LPS export ABC transporter permease LptG [Gammaproteobacteria bacterium]|uniref:LPS export ABC transporter permease LptG n=1 Tax=Candidatus Thiopontia autotrophica TaxID=2841688 RepID=A0A8J6P9K8_9GAMM|nr:LPS export ABC transporter permease LptG [Candidatus Thiopontia autotrophica]
MKRSSLDNNNILGWYLGREIVWGGVITLLSLVSIAYFVTFAGEMGNIGKQDFTTTTAVSFVLMKMPKIVQEMLPAAVLIGSLFSFGGLAASNELTIMRATGVSILGILWRVRIIGLLSVLIAVINMELVVPAAERGAKIIKAEALHESVVEYSREVFWLRDGDYFVRMQHVGSDGSVAGIQWMKIPEPGDLAEVSYADRAFHEGEEWRLEQVRSTQLDKSPIATVSADEAKHQSTISHDIIRLASRDPVDLSMVELYSYTAFLENSGLDAGSYQHAFWGRLAMPFSMLVMLVLAIPFSITEGRSLSAGKRVVMGVFLGIGFYLLNKVLMNTGEIYQFNPIVTAFLAPSLFLLSALWMIRKRGL